MWRADTDWKVEEQCGHAVLPGLEEAGEVGDWMGAMVLELEPRLVILARVPWTALDVRVGRLASEVLRVREEFRRCEDLV